MLNTQYHREFRFIDAVMEQEEGLTGQLLVTVIVATNSRIGI